MKISFMDEDKLAPDQFLCGSDQAAAPPKRETQESFYCLSPVEHLREARNALKDGYRIDSDPVKTVWGRLNDAKRHLLAIDPHTPQYNTAKALVDEVTLRKRQMQDAYASAVRQHMVNQRETLVNELEQYFINKGIYVEIELNGSDKTSLRVSSALFRVPSINRIADETAFFLHLKRVGFTKIVFENREGGVKVYKLESQE